MLQQQTRQPQSRPFGGHGTKPLWRGVSVCQGRLWWLGYHGPITIFQLPAAFREATLDSVFDLPKIELYLHSEVKTVPINITVESGVSPRLRLRLSFILSGRRPTDNAYKLYHKDGPRE